MDEFYSTSDRLQSEQQLKRKLELSRGVIPLQSSHLPVLSGPTEEVEVGGIRGIGDVEAFGAELDLLRFGDVEVFEGHK